MSARRQSSTHLPGLDGLRGLAIFGVIVVHTLVNAPLASRLDLLVGTFASFGWMGVDLFFVLSGFLITGILLDARTSPHYFRTFFARRLLRILPAYVAFLACCLWIAAPLGLIDPGTAERLHAAQGWYWSYLVNVMVALHGWAGGDGPTHLWSLAVEEQFYLLWPLTVLLLSPRALARAALACIVVAELFRIALVMTGGPPEANYVLLPMRMDTLAVGAFLACAVRDPALLRATHRWRLPAFALALVAIVWTLAREHALQAQHGLTQVGAYTAVAVLSGSLVFGVSQSPTLFAWAPLRWLGRYSYGIYLWHWLALALLVRRTTLLSPRLIGGSYLAWYGLAVAGALVTSVAFALVSWHVVEQPFLRLKRLVPYARGETQPVLAPSSIASSASVSA